MLGKLDDRLVGIHPEGAAALDATVAQIQRDRHSHRYDCLSGVSGGVDSTFVACKVKQFGLRRWPCTWTTDGTPRLRPATFRRPVTRWASIPKTLVIDFIRAVHRKFGSGRIRTFRHLRTFAEFDSYATVRAGAPFRAAQRVYRHARYGRLREE